MKKIFFVSLALAAFLISCGQKEMKVTLENTANFDRQEEIVEIPLETIEAKVSLKDGESYLVKDAQGQLIPVQVTYDGKLIFQSGLNAKEKDTYTIFAGTPQEYQSKVYGRHVTERYDDFAWENDRVAFRVYGPALVAIDGPSNGIDVWFKRTRDLVVDKWYKDDIAGVASYHEDHGEGLDDYKVGRSLGAGGMAPYVGGKLWLNTNYATQEVLENGPLRATVKLTYNNIDVDGKTYGETRTFSIDAGSQLSKVIEEYTGVDGTIPVAAGFVKRNGNDSIIANVAENYLIYAEPANEKVDNVYMGLLFPAGYDKSIVDAYTVPVKSDNKGKTTITEVPYSHVLGVANYKANTPLVYYTGYGWSKFGFPTLDSFQKYMTDYAISLKEPIVITIH